MITLSLNKQSGFYELTGPHNVYGFWNGEIKYAQYYSVWPLSTEIIRLIERCNPCIYDNKPKCVVEFATDNESDVLECSMVFAAMVKMELELV